MRGGPHAIPECGLDHATSDGSEQQFPAVRAAAAGAEPPAVIDGGSQQAEAGSGHGQYRRLPLASAPPISVVGVQAAHGGEHYY